MTKHNSDDTDTPSREIRLLKNPDRQWAVCDLHVGVTAQGESRRVVLENLDAVVNAVCGGGRIPTDDEIHELGILRRLDDLADEIMVTDDPVIERNSRKEYVRLAQNLGSEPESENDANTKDGARAHVRRRNGYRARRANSRRW